MYGDVLNYWSASHTKCGADLSWWFIHLYCYAVSGCRRERKMPIRGKFDNSYNYFVPTWQSSETWLIIIAWFSFMKKSPGLSWEEFNTDVRDCKMCEKNRLWTPRIIGGVVNGRYYYQRSSDRLSLVFIAHCVKKKERFAQKKGWLHLVEVLPFPFTHRVRWDCWWDCGIEAREGWR